MKVPKEAVCVARVLSEDSDFVTLEVAKHDKVSFTLQHDEDGKTVGGDNFLTLLFVHYEDGGMTIWKPWEASDE